MRRDEGDTIYALASGAGRAAVAIIRVSGPDCVAVLEAVCGEVDLPTRVATLVAIYDVHGIAVDRALVLRFAAPRSYTGEDLLEFQITGSRAVVAALTRKIATVPNLRPAKAGEFAWRAFLNGKIDLAEVDGLAQVVAAQTEAQLRFAQRAASGDLSRECERVRNLILNATAEAETLLDFSDVDGAPETIGAVLQPLRDAKGRLQVLLANENLLQKLQDGLTVVIAGPPNVGKSTLFNALARRDLAIVSAIAGTTRDALEVNLDIAGFPITLVDTAGLRETEDEIESEGVMRAKRRAVSADVVLWLRQAGEIFSDDPPDGAHVIRLVTKSDTLNDAVDGERALSAKTGQGLAELAATLAEIARESFAPDSDIILTTHRQRTAAQRAFEALARIEARPDIELELCAEELRTAADAIGQITGRVGVEEVLGEIFSRLCVGK